MHASCRNREREPEAQTLETGFGPAWRSLLGPLTAASSAMVGARYQCRGCRFAETDKTRVAITSTDRGSSGECLKLDGKRNGRFGS